MFVLVAQLLAGADTLSARAESLLAQGKLPEARRVAEQLVARRPRDPQAHLLLGRVWMRWPTFGRYNAYEEFRTAGFLTPEDPEPQYWKARVGMYLRSDEGEVIAREAILKLLALRSDYRDAWTVFESVYHDASIWRRADAALAHHPDDALALKRRAAIAIAVEAYGRADSLAALLLERRAPSVPAFLVRAEAQFQLRHPAAGQAWYDSAVVYADHDTSDAIWGQLWMIATPEEAARFDSLRLEERRGFFEAFWSRRDPDLLTPVNERLGEHYQRLAEVRRMFHLLHPWVGFQHSPYARALAQSYLDDSIQNLLSSAGLDGLDPATNAMPNLQAWNETQDTLTTYALTNLSACGLMWLRHGRPDVWETPEHAPVACAGSWTYYTPAGPLSVHFIGVPGPYGGHGAAIIAPPTTARGARAAVFGRGARALQPRARARGLRGRPRGDAGCDAGGPGLSRRPAARGVRRDLRSARRRERPRPLSRGVHVRAAARAAAAPPRRRPRSAARVHARGAGARRRARAARARSRPPPARALPRVDRGDRPRDRCQDHRHRARHRRPLSKACLAASPRPDWVRTPVPMLVNLVPEFLACIAAPDPVAAYHGYLDRHRPVLQGYWDNYVLDLDSPHAERVIADAL